MSLDFVVFFISLIWGFLFVCLSAFVPIHIHAFCFNFNLQSNFMVHLLIAYRQSKKEGPQTKKWC